MPLYTQAHSLLVLLCCCAFLVDRLGVMCPRSIDQQKQSLRLDLCIVLLLAGLAIVGQLSGQMLCYPCSANMSCVKNCAIGEHAAILQLCWQSCDDSPFVLVSFATETSVQRVHAIIQTHATQSCISACLPSCQCKHSQLVCQPHAMQLFAAALTLTPSLFLIYQATLLQAV